MIIKKFGVMLFIVVAIMLAFASSHSVWGKAHVPARQFQVCHSGVTKNVTNMEAHLDHGDCRLPACDNNNVFAPGSDCSGADIGAGDDGTFCGGLVGADPTAGVKCFPGF